MTPTLKVEEAEVRAWREITRRHDEPMSFDDWRFIVALCDSWLAAKRHLRVIDSPHTLDALGMVIGAQAAENALRVIRLAMELADRGHEAGEAAVARGESAAPAGETP